MEKYTIDELVIKLVGRIDPAGDTHIDNERFENMQTLIKVIDKLTFKLESSVWGYRNAQEYSVVRAVDEVKKFKLNTLNNLSDVIAEDKSFDQTLLNIIDYKCGIDKDFKNKLSELLQEEK